MVDFLGMVALFTLLHRADVGENLPLCSMPLLAIFSDLQALNIQVAHPPMLKVGVICCRHGHHFVC